MLSAAVVCLALTMYHEGRGEGPTGMIAIGQVVLNRSGKALVHKDVCSVVHEGGPLPLYKCQFAWYCDGVSDVPYNRGAWILSLTLSRAMLEGRVGYPHSQGVTCYYAKRTKIRPKWATSDTFKFTEGNHNFHTCR